MQPWYWMFIAMWTMVMVVGPSRAFAVSTLFTYEIQGNFISGPLSGQSDELDFDGFFTYDLSGGEQFQSTGNEDAVGSSLTLFTGEFFTANEISFSVNEEGTILNITATVNPTWTLSVGGLNNFSLGGPLPPINPGTVSNPCVPSLTFTYTNGGEPSISVCDQTTGCAVTGTPLAINAVPEPSTLFLLGTGLIAMLGGVRQWRRKAARETALRLPC